MYTIRQQLIGRRWRRSWRSRGWVLGIFLGFLGGWQASQAAEFMCTSTGGVGNIDCLITTINTANGNGQTNTIHLAAGTYTLTAINNGTFGDTTGLPVITSPLTIQGAEAETTIIERDANALETFRLLRIATTGTLTIKGLTLRGGKVISYSGGGILNFGTLTLTNCALTDNTAEGGGGGVLLTATSAL